MKSDNILTQQIAKAFLGNALSIDLRNYDVIEEKAAAILSRYRKPINLDGLTSISEQSAKHLMNHKGGRLSLRGLKMLSLECAKRLRKHPHLATRKELDKLVQIEHQHKLDQAFADIDSYGIVVDSSIPRSIKKSFWCYYPEDWQENDVMFDVLSRISFEDRASDASLPVGSRGFYLDFEAIYDEGDYTRILEKLAFISGQSSRLSEIEDHVDVPGGEVWIKFKFDGRLIEMTPGIHADWACPETVNEMTRILTPKDAQFFGIDCSQSVVFYCFPRRIAEKIKQRIEATRAEVLIWPN